MKIKIFSMTIFFLLIGCINEEPAQSNLGVNPTSSPIYYETTLPTSLPQSISIPTIPSEAKLKIACAKTINEIPKSNIFNALPVIATKEESKSVFLLVAQNEKKEILNDEGAIIPTAGLENFMASSPDGKWLAYIKSDTSKNWLVIMSDDKIEYKKITVNAEVIISRWLDNENLLLSEKNFPQSKQFVINLFTEEKQELSITFSDLYDTSQVNNWGNIIVYSPDLTKLVYAGSPADIVLVDTKDLRIVNRLSPVSVTSSVPVWSPNSESFIITYTDILNPINDSAHWKFEIYNISQDGEIVQLTNLSSYYNYPRIPYYQWSPNGKFIAFWLESDPLNNPGVFEFSILSLDSGIVENSCLVTNAKGRPLFFWSPDSKQIIIETISKNENYSSKIILFDVVENWAVNVGENLIPVGWMLNQ